MGKDYIDFWTFTHFFSGFLMCSSLLPTYPLSGFFISNIIHLWMEYIENSNLGDIVLESQENHVGDITGFFIGSLIGAIWGRRYFLDDKGGLQNNKVRYFIIFLGFISMIQEVCRELFPETWIFDSAYKPFKWFPDDEKKEE